MASTKRRVTKTTRRTTTRINYANATNKKWIQTALKNLNKGQLHEELGLSPKTKIPPKMLAKAARSKNPTIRRQAILAETLHRFHK
ncbi:MAG: hypothetical protein ACYCQI_12045 [Gammaproteobacteria bacterium]